MAKRERDLGTGEIVVDLPSPSQSSPSSDEGRDGNESRNSAGGGIPSGQTTANDQGYWTPELFAPLIVRVVDLWCTRSYDAPLNDVEAAALQTSVEPVLKKYLAGPISPEWAAIGMLAMIILPRYLSRGGKGEKHDSSSDGAEGIRQNTADPSAGGSPLDEVSKILSASARPQSAV